MKKSVLSVLMLLGMVSVAMSLAGCGSGGGDSSTPASGNSSIGAPASIIGKTVVLTVTKNDGSQNIIGVGKTITYSFINADKILGVGLVTIPTESWSYVLTGNVAKVDMNMSVGWSKDSWTFTSATEGTYHSDTGLITGTSGWHEGTFKVSDNTVSDSSIAVTGMSPSTGTPGTTVTIAGTNFSTTLANNAVNFNGTQATVTAATATSITVKVPTGATTGTVTVTVGGTSKSAGSFTVTAAVIAPVNLPVNLYILYGVPVANNPDGLIKDPIMGTCRTSMPPFFDSYNTLPGYSSVFFQEVGSGLTSAQCQSAAVQNGLDASLMF